MYCARNMPPPATIKPEHVGDFKHWVQTDRGSVHIHLLRFTTLEAPKAEIIKPVGPARRRG
jgi:hypothetical protein